MIYKTNGFFLIILFNIQFNFIFNGIILEIITNLQVYWGKPSEKTDSVEQRCIYHYN